MVPFVENGWVPKREIGQPIVFVVESGDDGIQDTTAPQLVALSISPSTVDTRSGSAEIVVTARITDDLSGNTNSGSISYVRFQSPSGSQHVEATFMDDQRTSGDMLDGIYQYTMTVPRYSESGTWAIQQVYLRDNVGNHQSLTADAVTALIGAPVNLQLIGSDDVIAPQLAALSLSPSTVNTNDGAVTIAVTAHITDNLSGLSMGEIRFVSPSQGQFIDAVFRDDQRTTGDMLDGIYQYTMTLPRYSETGTWTIAYASFRDGVGNTRRLTAGEVAGIVGSPVVFEQTGLQDIAAPELTALSLSPSTVNTNDGAATIAVTAHITDNLSGLSMGEIRFVSPSQGQFIDAVFRADQRTSGDMLDGIYQYTMTLPRYSETGTWTIAYASFRDSVGNTRRLTAVEVAGIVGSPVVFAQMGIQDIVAPQLAALSLSPSTVNTNDGAATIAVTAHITDNLSGLSMGEIRFVSPSQGQFIDAVFRADQRTSGDMLDGIYQYTMTLPRYSETGTWTIAYASFRDGVGNTSRLTAGDVAGIVGSPVVFEQTGLQDITAPVLAALSLSSSSVNTNAGAATITVTARITDDLSGNTNSGSISYVRFQSPSGNQYAEAIFMDAQRISGTMLDGIYQYTMTVPRYSESGTWTIQQFHLRDNVGNQQSLTADEVADIVGDAITIEQSGLGDTNPPQLVALSLSPSAVDTRDGPADIVVTARITDDLSGNTNSGSISYVRFQSPSNSQYAEAIFMDAQRISGTMLDGVYRYTMTVPQYSETGTWTIQQVYLRDNVGNHQSLTADAVTALIGAPVNLQQTGN